MLADLSSMELTELLTNLLLFDCSRFFLDELRKRKKRWNSFDIFPDFSEALIKILNSSRNIVNLILIVRTFNILMIFQFSWILKLSLYFVDQRRHYFMLLSASYFLTKLNINIQYFQLQKSMYNHF